MMLQQVKSERFLKSQRVLKRREFLKIKRNSKKVCGSLFILNIVETGRPARIGITVIRRFGCSVQRNLLKRRIREVFRKEASNFYGYDINIYARTEAKNASFSQIREELLKYFVHET